MRLIADALEAVTEEGHAFRVDLRLRPEGRMGALVLSLDGYRAYFADRAELWERQALIKARFCAGDPRGGRALLRAGPPLRLPAGPRRRHRRRGAGDEGRDRPRRSAPRASSRRNVKLGVGGIREVEFLVQALQLLYGGDDPWLRERNSLRAIFRLTERGYLSPGARALPRRRARPPAHRRAPPADPPRVPDAHAARRSGRRSGVWRGAWASRLPPAAARRRFLAEHARVTRGVHRAFREFFAAPPAAAATRVRIPSYTALKATGFADPDRARQNLRLVLEGRPLTPYPAAARRALAACSPCCSTRSGRRPIPTRR